MKKGMAEGWKGGRIGGEKREGKKRCKKGKKDTGRVGVNEGDEERKEGRRESLKLPFAHGKCPSSIFMLH